MDPTQTLVLPLIFGAIFLYCLYGVIYRAVKNAIKDANRELTDKPGQGQGLRRP